MKQSNLVALALLFGGIAFALYYLITAFFSPEQPLKFAIACVVAAIGWQEFASTEQFNDRGRK